MAKAQPPRTFDEYVARVVAVLEKDHSFTPEQSLWMTSHAQLKQMLGMSFQMGVDAKKGAVVLLGSIASSFVNHQMKVAESGGGQ